MSRRKVPRAITSPAYWFSWIGVAVARAAAYLPIDIQRSFGRALGVLLHRLLRSRRHVAEGPSPEAMDAAEARRL